MTSDDSTNACAQKHYVGSEIKSLTTFTVHERWSVLDRFQIYKMEKWNKVYMLDGDRAEAYAHKLGVTLVHQRFVATVQLQTSKSNTPAMYLEDGARRS